MKKVILIALILTGCRVVNPETVKVIQKDLSQLEIDVMQSQLDEMKNTPEVQ